MKIIKYKKYTKKEMLKIIKKVPIVIVETSLNDSYIIRKKDIADFIMLEANRTGYCVDMEFYLPNMIVPLVTTCGCFLDKVNNVLREEIIHRLTLLQTHRRKPKNVKIFDNEIFLNMNFDEIENDIVKNLDKFCGKYIKGV